MQQLHCLTFFEKLLLQTLHIFQKPTALHQFRAQYYVWLALLPSHKSKHSPCCYCQRQKIKKHEAGMTSNGLKIVPNFMKIGQLFKKL